MPTMPAGDAGGLLVVAPHALDEVLGCGGLIALSRDAGARVDVVVAFGDGTAHDAERRAAAARAAEILGHHPPTFLGLPENRGDTVPLGDIIGPLEALIGQTGADRVFVPFANSLHADHKKTYQAAITAARPLPGSTVSELCAYEIVSSTDWVPAADGAFVPDTHVDIAPALDRKLDAIDAYAVEMREEPHARSRAAVERLARVRGNTVGFEAAEGFVTLRRRIVSA